MTVEEVRNRAKTLGVAVTARMRKGDMIRTIQQAEGNQDCFGSAWRFDCPWDNCCWRGDCLSKNPG